MIDDLDAIMSLSIISRDQEAIIINATEFSYQK